MKKYIWKRFIAVGVTTMVLAAVTADCQEKQKFKFSDLFKKTSTSKTSDKSKVEAEKKETTAKETSTSTDTAKPKVSESTKPSNSDQIKALVGKLDKSKMDPDELLRRARERMNEEKGASSKKEPAAVAKPSSEDKKTKVTSESPKAEKKAVAKTAAPEKAAPAKVEEKKVTAGVVKSAPKPKDASSRPPSLASVTAIAAVPAAAPKAEAPPANLQASLAVSNVPAPKPKVAASKKQAKKSKSEVMEIVSDEAETDFEKNTVTFIGNVVLTDPTFNLTCDRLLIYLNEKGVEADGEFKKAIATGAIVVVERINEKGDKDVGQSRQVEYDAKTGDIVLSGGPPVLQSGGGLVNTKSPDATITLKRDGNHSVKDKSKFIIPVKGKKGGAAKGPNLVPSKLGDISNRNR